jgi:Ser/Thr protein kinase RdoA (MazF antagonist)
MMHEFDGLAHDEQEAQADLVDLNEVMRAFGISTWTNLGPAETTQAESLSLLVEVQGKRYLLKERQEVMVEADPQHRYAFQRYLQQHGIPIPTLQLTPTRDPAVTVGEDSFELQAWPDGEAFGSESHYASQWVRDAGTMLGRIHQASLRYPGKQHRWPSEVHMGALVQSWLQLARVRAEQSEIQAIAVALSNWADQWERVLPSAMMSIGAAHMLPELHIHGDYHAHNLRFSPSGVVAVMGLDASRWEKRLFEVAYALFSFSALHWRSDSEQTRPLTKRGLEPERAHQFLQAYREIYPPAPGEAALLSAALMLVAPIATVNGPLEDLFFAPSEMEAGDIDDVMERLTWAASLPGWLMRVKEAVAEMWEQQR